CSSPILSRCLQRRPLFETGAPERSESSQNPSGVTAELPCLSGLNSGGQHRYHDPLAASSRNAIPSPDSSRLAGVMPPNAVVLLSVSARHVGGLAETCRLPSHILAEQAAPGNLSGPQGRARAADHALWITRSNPDRAMGGSCGLCAFHTCLALGDFGSAAA